MIRSRRRILPALFMATIGLMGQAFAQGDCLNADQYPANLITPNANGTLTPIATCSFQIEYSVITGIISGSDYEFVGAGSTYITLRQGTFDGAVIGQGTSPVTVTPTTNGNIFAHWNVDNMCATASTCIVTSVQRLLNCELPVVTVSYTEDCTANNFMVLVNIAGTGDGATVDLQYGLAGNLQTMLGVDTGVTALGPFPAGSQPTLLVMHESDPDCNINFGVTAPFSECAIAVVCGAGSVNQSYCYADNDDVSWTYTSTGGTGSLVLSFVSGSIQSNPNDRLVIYDGFDNTGAILFNHTSNQTFDLTGLTVISTTGSLYMELLANAFTSCAAGSFGITAWDWKVECLDCQIPAATAVVTDDCPNNAFNIAVNVTATGDATTVDLVYIVDGGAAQTMASVSTGITNLGPFTVGSSVSVSVNHDNDASCDLDLGVFTDLNTCPLIIDCGAPATIETYCYVANDSQFWFYQSGGAGTMRLRFLRGTIESNSFDDLIIYDGIDNTAPILFVHGNATAYNLGPVGSAIVNTGTNFYGIEVYATGNGLYMEMSSDGSVQCSGSTTYDSWEWEVVCLDCTIPIVSTGPVDNCANSEFSLPVVVTSTGDAATVNIVYTINGGAAQTVAGIGVGTESIGPFTFNDTINVIIEHGTNSLCNVSLGNFTDTGTCPLLIDCGTEVGDELCYENNTDRRYYYQGTGTLPLAVVFDSGTVSAGDLIIVYDGGDITAPVLFSGNNGGNIAGLFFNTTNPQHRLTVRVTSNGFTACSTSTTQNPIVWRVFCLDCVPPSATFQIVQDCVNFQYNMVVVVATMGTDPSMELINTAGAPALTVTAAGTYSVGPIASGTPVEVTLVNDMNDLCNVRSGVRVNPVCPIPVCGSSVIEETYCYVANDSMAWAYELPTAGTLRLTFQRGTIESNVYDNLVIYDGTDNTAPVLFIHAAAGANLGPEGSAILSANPLYETIDVTATGSNLYMEMSSDGSVQCGAGSTYDPWEWTVYCDGCEAPGISYNLIADCFSRSYVTEVIVTSQPPSEGIHILNTETGDSLIVNAIGVYEFGPYPTDSLSVFAITALDEPGCVYVSEPRTVTSQSCVIVSCGYDTYDHCYGNNEDRWYTYKSASNVPTTIQFNWGQLLAGDEIIIYNGPNANSAVLFQGNNGGDLTGFALNSQNAANTITLRIRSNGSGSCDDGQATSSLNWFVGCGAVGIDETGKEGFAMYPNPTTGLLTIDLATGKYGNAQVRVIDMSGRTVIEKPLNVKAGSVNTIDMSELVLGQYMVQITTDRWVRTEQVQLTR